MQIYWIAALLFGIVIALFAVQNSQPITVRFLWLSAEGLAVSVLVMICAALGAMVTLMFGLGREVRLQWSRRAVRRTVRSHEGKIVDLEKTIEQLRLEKSELQARLDALSGDAAGVPRYEAIPVTPPSVEGSEPRPALPDGEPSPPSEAPGRGWRRLLGRPGE